MTISTATDPRTRLRQIGADVRQLTEPIQLAVRRRILTHPALLDQLRAAVHPGATMNDTKVRQVPASRPPVHLAAIDALAEITVELAGWHARHDLPSPPRNTDWTKAVLRQMVGLAPGLTPEVADWLTRDVREWWRLAAVHSGWRPADLLKLQ